MPIFNFKSKHKNFERSAHVKRFRSTLIVLLALLLCLSLVTGCAESANKAGNQEEPDKKTEEQPQANRKKPRHNSLCIS